MPTVDINRGHYAVAGLVLLVAATLGIIAINVRVGR